LRSAIISNASHGRAVAGGSTPMTSYPSCSYSLLTSGVEHATTVLAGVSRTRSSVPASIALTVTSANSSVGRVSTTPTTIDRMPSCTLNRSIAACRRSNPTGFRLVMW
jgi:hypothetical protein